VLAVVGTVLIALSVGGLALLAAGPVGEFASEGPLAMQADEPRATRAGADQPPVTPEPAANPGVEAVGASQLDSAPTSLPPSFRTVLDESFADNRMGWLDNPQSTAWLANGTYRLFAREPRRFVAIAAPLVTPLYDVVVSATFRKTGGPPGGGYGLIVRDQGPTSREGVNQSGRYYVIEVGDRGQIGMWRREEDQWIELLPWTPSEAVHPGGESNELEVWAVGQRLALFVNGVQVASRLDGNLPTGGVGLFVGGDFNEVALERLVVREPAIADAPPSRPVTGAVTGDGRAADSRAPSLSANPTAVPTPTPRPFMPITRLVIPSISLDAPAMTAGLVDKAQGVTWQVPPFVIGHARGTGGAGGPGNAVLVGHVTSLAWGNVFANLHRVRLGDMVRVFSGDQGYEYRVVDVHTTGRTDVSVVGATPSPAITLLTCTGLWLPLLDDYAERLVVRGELVPE
jgi:LPXTG-site transpeptidase (sortase) family protein